MQLRASAAFGHGDASGGQAPQIVWAHRESLPQRCCCLVVPSATAHRGAPRSIDRPRRQTPRHAANAGARAGTYRLRVQQLRPVGAGTINGVADLLLMYPELRVVAGDVQPGWAGVRSCPRHIQIGRRRQIGLYPRLIQLWAEVCQQFDHHLGTALARRPHELIIGARQIAGQSFVVYEDRPGEVGPGCPIAGAGSR